jgi:hypothetical protein
MVGPTIVIGIALLSAVVLALILRARQRSKERGFKNAPNQVSSQADPVEAEIARAIRQAVPERFVVFDLETTGLDPASHEIIEIGAIKVHRDSARHDGFQCLVKPKKRISKRITQINGISQQMVYEQGEPLDTVLKDFAEFIENLPLVSFNAEFIWVFYALLQADMALRSATTFHVRWSWHVKLGQGEKATDCAIWLETGNCPPRGHIAHLRIANELFSSTWEPPQSSVQGGMNRRPARRSCNDDHELRRSSVRWSSSRSVSP